MSKQCLGPDCFIIIENPLNLGGPHEQKFCNPKCSRRYHNQRIKLRKKTPKQREFEQPRESIHRRPPSTETQRQVYDRDNGVCVQCGSSVNIQFDHIIPYKLGGSNTVDNIQILCLVCNAKKRTTVGWDKIVIKTPVVEPEVIQAVEEISIPVLYFNDKGVLIGRERKETDEPVQEFESFYDWWCKEFEA